MRRERESEGGREDRSVCGAGREETPGPLSGVAPRPWRHAGGGAKQGAEHLARGGGGARGRLLGGEKEAWRRRRRGHRHSQRRWEGRAGKDACEKVQFKVTLKTILKGKKVLEKVEK